ncbi:MAG: NAD(P)/FAD-dependent oxidoreductase [Planctomycetaceae bacterium]|nr:NAD(P)/FAD-dependent oxidoreductase [Planctomycetaceae bacterium]
MKYDCIIIGGGHNGLVCAAYLARAGRKVLVLERRPFPGGACVTEELWPGFRISTAAYVVSLLLPEIERDLDLKRHGYEVLRRVPSSFTPFEDGRHLFLGPDAAQNQSEIGKFSQRDAERFPQYEKLLTQIAEKLEPVLSNTPPDLLPMPAEWRRTSWGKKLRDFRTSASIYRAFGTLGNRLPEAIELLTGAARPILDRWFESDELKGTLATDAIIGNFQSVSAPGTAYVLLHHVMGSSGGARGVWGYVRGGMGQLSEAIASAAREAGAEIRFESEVAEILAEQGLVKGVRLTTGECFESSTVASGVDANLTFRKFLSEHHLPEDFRQAVDRIDYSSACVKINLAMSELPKFSCLNGKFDSGSSPGPQHNGTIHINARMQDLEDAWFDAVSGRPSRKPIVEMTIPTSVDSTIAPPGMHIASMFVQYAPYHLGNGTWDDHREAFADACIEQVNRFAPNFAASVVHRQILTPVDIERIYGLTGGNIFQGAMPLHQLFSMRPVAGWSDYRTPLEGLYLCGSAAHPGGGVMGACGRNAALEILRDHR